MDRHQPHIPRVQLCFGVRRSLHALSNSQFKLEYKNLREKWSARILLMAARIFRRRKFSSSIKLYQRGFGSVACQWNRFHRRGRVSVVSLFLLRMTALAIMDLSSLYRWPKRRSLLLPIPRFYCCPSLSFVRIVKLQRKQLLVIRGRLQ